MTTARDQARPARPDEGRDRRGTTGRWPGPFESWLIGFLDEAIARSGTAAAAAATVSSVDVGSSSKLGEARAQVRFPGSAGRDKSAWKQLAVALSTDPLIRRVVAVPPTLYVTLEDVALETGLVHAAKANVLVPREPDSPGVVVVFCSPNTNKPLHIGHLRACFLGMSVYRLVQATGAVAQRSQMLSNFGIHMCQAHAMYDGNSTPATAGVKGDHFVGMLYRAFHDAACAPDAACEPDGCLRHRAAQLLRDIAGGVPDLSRVNRQLGEWAIEGILATQHSVGTAHDLCLRESEVIPIAVDAIDRAVTAGVCHRRPDGSVYLPVRSTGDAELTLLRRDGTSLVFSMLLGIYLTRSEAYPEWQVLELTGEQWRSGRTAMYELLERIGRGDLSSRTEGVFFGMVKLGERVMQSRDGSVVQADGLLRSTAERVHTWHACAEHLRASGDARHRTAVALLKYHVLRFPRADGFSFDEESMWSDATARFSVVLQALAWARSVLAREAGPSGSSPEIHALALALARHSVVCGRALDRRDPSILVRYIDDVAMKVKAAERREGVSRAVASSLSHVLTTSLHLLGIEVADLSPE